MCYPTPITYKVDDAFRKKAATWFSYETILSIALPIASRNLQKRPALDEQGKTLS